MTTILIVAELDGTMGAARIDTESLVWIPLDIGDIIEPDTLPHQICRIEIGVAMGHFSQEIPQPAPPPIPWWRRLVSAMP